MLLLLLQGREEEEEEEKKGKSKWNFVGGADSCLKTSTGALSSQNKYLGRCGSAADLAGFICFSIRELVQQSVMLRKQRVVSGEMHHCHGLHPGVNHTDHKRLIICLTRHLLP